MNTYKLECPNTTAVWFPTAQASADYLFNFRHSPDFEKYKLTDTNTNQVFKVENCSTLNGIELTQINR